MQLAQSTLLNGAAVAARMCSSLVLNKILAVLIGPSGYAIVGQLQNIQALVNALGSATTGHAVTIGTAARAHRPKALLRLWRAAATLLIANSLLVTICVVALATPISSTAFGRENIGWLPVCVALAVMPAALNSHVLAILNGLQKLRLHVLASTLGSAGTLVYVGALSLVWGLNGALFAFATNPIILLAILLFTLAGERWFRPREWIGARLAREPVRHILKYLPLVTATAAIWPMTQVVARSTMIARLGAEQTGQWEALSRMSVIYLSFITTTLSFYFLPKVASADNLRSLQREAASVGAFAVVGSASLAALIYVSRSWIMPLLFSDQFSVSGAMLRWQLSGDVLKAGSWVLGYILIGRYKIKDFIICETLSAVTFIASIWFLLPRVGIEAASVAYCITYGIYFICVLMAAFGTTHRRLGLLK